MWIRVMPALMSQVGRRQCWMQIPRLFALLCSFYHDRPRNVVSRALVVAYFLGASGYAEKAVISLGSPRLGSVKRNDVVADGN